LPPSPILPPTPIQVQVFVSADSAGTVTAPASQPQGLVSWWQAEGDATDALSANNGTNQGASFVPGRVGQAFGFAGSGEVLVPSSASLQPSTITVMAWVKHLGFPGPNNYLVSKGAQDCQAASYALYTSAQTPNLLFGVFDGVNGPQSPDTGPPGIDVWDGNWHF